MVNRIITKKDLQKYSSEILGMIEREKIGSISELEEKIGESFPTPEGLIQLESRPSTKGSLAITISYIIDGKGIPIEIRLNPEQNYSLFFVKSEEEIESYNPELVDPLGNVIQSKKIGSSFEEALEELKRLSSV
ncbi:MAG: hypothetical protein AABW93_01045 [Nanoarchaeota archaeon]